MPSTAKAVDERLLLSTGRKCAIVRVRNEWIPKYYLLTFPKSEGEPTPVEVAEMLVLGLNKARRWRKAWLYLVLAGKNLLQALGLKKRRCAQILAR